MYPTCVSSKRCEFIPVKITIHEKGLIWEFTGMPFISLTTIIPSIIIINTTTMVIMIMFMIASIVMINLQNMVTSAAIDRNNYGDASDHLPINAVLQM